MNKPPGIAQSFFSAALNVVTSILSAMLSTTTSIFGGIVSAVGGALANIGSNIAGAFGSFLSGVAQGWSRVNEQTGGKLNEWMGIVSRALSSVVSFFAGLGGRVLGAVADFGSVLFNSGKALVQGLIDGVGRAIEGLLSLI